jgi:hypothetical protein
LLINKIEKDIIIAEKSIYELDYRAEIEFNKLWPYQIINEISINNNNNTNNSNNMDNVDDINNQEDIKLDIDINIQEKLEERIVYLRNVYNFCIYCGHTYENTEDLINNCPGLYEDDH